MLSKGLDFEPRGRAFCLNCRRAQVHCFCAEMRPIETRIEWVILQHPREFKRTVGTARIAHLGLLSSQILCGLNLDENPRAKALLDDPNRFSTVLYPGADALDLSRQTSEERAELLRRKLTVFVIDGTWLTARTLLNRNPRIAGLPKVSFSVERPSEYGFRQQPHEQCLSTVEAVCRLVEVMEPHLDASPLLKIFRKMVERQLGYTAYLDNRSAT